MSSNRQQDLVDRLARRLVVARMALDVLSTPETVAFHLASVSRSAEAIAALPGGTGLPRPGRVFGPATAALLTEAILGASPVPDSVPEVWAAKPLCGGASRAGPVESGPLRRGSVPLADTSRHCVQ